MSERRRRLHTVPAPPPRKWPAWHRLLVVPRDGTIKVLSLADAVVGVMRHYNRATGRMSACTSPHEPCVPCAAGVGALWSGYLPVAARDGDHYTGRTLVVPQEAFRNCPALAAGRLRGRWLHCWRLISRHNGPVRITLGEQVVSPDRVMAGWDVETELAIRFGLADRDDFKEEETA